MREGMTIALERGSELGKACKDLLAFIADEGLTEIIPEYSPERGFYYPELKNAPIRGAPLTELLEKLVEGGFLKRRPWRYVVECPVCGSTRLIASFKCPNCGSRNLSRNTLVTHIPCGYIGILEEMEVRGGKRICPKCGLPLEEKGIDYEQIGAVYGCKDCGYRAEMPVPAYDCTECGKEFDHREAEYRAWYAYEVVPEALEGIEREILEDMIAAQLQMNNLKVKQDVVIKGRIGLLHQADLEVLKGDKKVYIDLVIGKSDFLKVLGKRMDVDYLGHIVLIRHTISPQDMPDVRGSKVKVIRYHRLKEAVRSAVEEVLRMVKS